MSGDGVSTGVVTGIARSTIDSVRAGLEERSEFLRAVRAELHESVRAEVAAAAIDDWQSLAKTAYDLMRGGLDVELAAIGLIADAAALEFDGAELAVRLEREVQFPWQ